MCISTYLPAYIRPTATSPQTPFLVVLAVDHFLCLLLEIFLVITILLFPVSVVDELRNSTGRKNRERNFFIQSLAGSNFLTKDERRSRKVFARARMEWPKGGRVVGSAFRGALRTKDDSSRTTRGFSNGFFFPMREFLDGEEQFIGRPLGSKCSQEKPLGPEGEKVKRSKINNE